MNELEHRALLEADRARRRTEHAERNAEGIRRATLPPGEQQALAMEARDRRARSYTSKNFPIARPDWSRVPVGPGLCTPNVARCARPNGYQGDSPACCIAQCVEILRWTGTLLDYLGIPWWLDYGSLLGAVRFQGFIPWDADTDVGIMESDLPKLLQAEAMIRRYKLGFYGTSKNKMARVYVSPRNRLHTDIFCWFVNERGLLDRKWWADVDTNKGREYPAEWLLPLTTVTFAGHKMPAPAAVRFPGVTPAPNVPGFEQGSAFLEWRYGPRWMEDLRVGRPEHERAGWPT